MYLILKSYFINIILKTNFNIICSKCEKCRIIFKRRVRLFLNFLEILLMFAIFQLVSIFSGLLIKIIGNFQNYK